MTTVKDLEELKTIIEEEIRLSGDETGRLNKLKEKIIGNMSPVPFGGDGDKLVDEIKEKFLTIKKGSIKRNIKHLSISIDNNNNIRGENVNKIRKLENDIRGEKEKIKKYRKAESKVKESENKIENMKNEINSLVDNIKVIDIDSDIFIKDKAIYEAANKVVDDVCKNENDSIELLKKISKNKKIKAAIKLCNKRKLSEAAKELDEKSIKFIFNEKINYYDSYIDDDIKSDVARCLVGKDGAKLGMINYHDGKIQSVEELQFPNGGVIETDRGGKIEIKSGEQVTMSLNAQGGYDVKIIGNHGERNCSINPDGTTIQEQIPMPQVGNQSNRGGAYMQPFAPPLPLSAAGNPVLTQYSDDRSYTHSGPSPQPVNPTETESAWETFLRIRQNQ